MICRDCGSCCCGRTEFDERGEELPVSLRSSLPPPFALFDNHGMGVRRAPPSASSEPILLANVEFIVRPAAEPLPLLEDMALMSGTAGGRG